MSILRSLLTACCLSALAERRFTSRYTGGTVGHRGCHPPRLIFMAVGGGGVKAIQQFEVSCIRVVCGARRRRLLKDLTLSLSR